MFPDTLWLAVQIVYYDGQFDDARLNVSLACTAALAGAAIVNYAEVTELLKVYLHSCHNPHPSPVPPVSDHRSQPGVSVLSISVTSP